ncbi:hypothetical protein MK805_08730 [Shimazuella sp. AN120528]|uniref:hypothetical protein n=1 Tax=Shimazuella soli TaxID=1892854 RepID=UPI001F108766|nr:hypothetical protein [Shimazuella soli]MCH5585054.1 hypothetical protein [Shimazuella soli]
MQVDVYPVPERNNSYLLRFREQGAPHIEGMSCYLFGATYDPDSKAFIPSSSEHMLLVANREHKKSLSKVVINATGVATTPLLRDPLLREEEGPIAMLLVDEVSFDEVTVRGTELVNSLPLRWEQ